MNKELQPQGQEHDLIRFLAGEYVEALRASGSEDAEARAKLARAKEFITFARVYLTENRPRALEHPDDNYRITLSNGKRANISPPAERLHGTMVSATGVPIDPNPAAPLQDVIANQGAVPISGVKTSNHFAVDHSKADGKGAVDRAASRPAVDYKKKGVVDDILNR